MKTQYSRHSFLGIPLCNSKKVDQVKLKTAFYIPSPALQHFITNIMIGEAQIPAHINKPTAIFPATPQQCIYFYPKDSIKTNRQGETGYKTIANSIVVAAQINRINIEIEGNHLVVCVSFIPSMLNIFLHCSIKEICDYDYETELFFGREIGFVNEQLAEAKTHSEMIKTVENFLLNKIKTIQYFQLPFDYSIKKMIKSDGLISIDKAASLACISNRQFERQFYERLGISPKLFQRIIKFSKAYRIKENKPQLKWTSIAYECGYFDQMHLIKEFKIFAGVTPSILSNQITQSGLLLQKDIQV